VRPFSGLERVGVRPWSLFEAVARLEASGLPWQLQERAGHVLIGVGVPVGVEGLPRRGPGFVTSEFFAEGALVIRSYPLVVSVREARVDLLAAERTATGLVEVLDAVGTPRRRPARRSGPWPVVPGVVREEVARAREAILEGRLDKLVVAARLEVAFVGEFVVASALAGLGRAHPASMRYYADGWCGASPELVVAKQGRRVWLRPLAGTATRGQAAALLASAKDLAEHRLLVDQLLEDLAPLVDELERPQPELLDVGALVHLATSLQGRLQPGVTLRELASAIAPTAAVSGVPRKEALVFLEEWEPWRDRYGGLVGVVDPDGDGELYLAIRGVRVHADSLEVTAGAGVVAGSVPELEHQEIQAKIDAVLRAVLDR